MNNQVSNEVALAVSSDATQGASTVANVGAPVPLCSICKDKLSIEYEQDGSLISKPCKCCTLMNQCATGHVLHHFHGKCPICSATKPLFDKIERLEAELRLYRATGKTVANAR